VQARPKPRVRERKLNLKSKLGRIGVLFGWLGEANDAIDAVWQALPNEYRHRVGKGNKHTPQGKLRDLWDHYDQIDMWEAMKNLAYNQAVDFAVGKFNQVGNEAYFRGFDDLGITGPAVGPGFGGAQTRYLTEGATRGIQETKENRYVRRPPPPERRIPRTSADALFYR